MTTVRFSHRDGVATVTLDRPASLNSMTVEFMDDLSEALAKIESEPSIRVAVLTGEGRGFCSGADLSGFANQGPSGQGAGDPTAAMDEHFHPAIRALADLSVPTIARVNGVAAGGGFGLAMTCDVAVACRSAFFVSTFGPRLGVVPDLGTTWHLTHRVGRARARGIAMLGQRISADQAKEWGLIWDVVEDDRLDDAVDDLAQQLSQTSSEAMTRIRSALDVAATNTLAEQLDVERDHQRVLIPRNMAEGAAAFMEKREPVFPPTR